jgi:transcriptional regulator with XRE-family HTH domain
VSNKDLATLMGVSPSMASRVRNGKRLPSTKVVMQIHERMSIPLDDLMAAHTQGCEEFGKLISQYARR